MDWIAGHAERAPGTVVLVDPQVPWKKMRRTFDDCDWLPAHTLLIADRDLAETAVEAESDQDPRARSDR